MSLTPSIMHVEPSCTRIRTLVVNHSSSQTEAIASILERDARIDVIATAKDGIIGLRTALAQVPDLVVIDANAVCHSGLEPAESLKTRLPGAKIIVICDDDHYLVGIAKGIGADALLTSSRLSTECESQLVRLFPA
jgi:chemotaxis response regulator CheB